MNKKVWEDPTLVKLPINQTAAGPNPGPENISTGPTGGTGGS